MSWLQIAGLSIFVITYFLIISERLHRLKASLAGIAGAMFFHIIDQSEAFSYIDFNTIGLLMGMMIIVAILRKTGIIQYLAVRAVKLSRGNPWYLLVLLSALTAVASAFLDNVTTVLMIGPVAIAVSEVLRISPVPFIFGEIFSANIGGTATLIGDPPNLLIGSAAGLTFNDFLVNLGPAVLASMVVMFCLLYLWFGKELKSTDRTREVAKTFREPKVVDDKVFLHRIVGVIALVIVGFALHGMMGLEAATIALSGAALALIICPVDVEEIIKEVDWITILFFSSLFMLVGTLEHLGLIHILAEKIFTFFGDRPKMITVLLVWGSGLISAVVDNVPYTAAVIPLVRDFASMSSMGGESLWWSLALGACFGGNGTLVGASANLVMSGIAERSGIRITFISYLARGAVVMSGSLAVSTIYIFIRYL